MPDQYEVTLGKLQNCLTDDQICAVLSCADSSACNKMMLDCLIERISDESGLPGFCDQLQCIAPVQDIVSVIDEIRNYGNCQTEYIQ